MTQILSVVITDQEAFVPQLSIAPRSSNPQRFRRPETAGVTFIEMLILFVVVGILVSITSRSVSAGFAATARRSASREVAAYVNRTRTLAIQLSRTAYLVRNGNVLKIVVDSLGTKVQIGTTIDLLARYTATLTKAALPVGARDTMQFDPRGFAVNTATLPKFIITRSAKSDTVCLTGLGRVTTRSC